VTKGILLKQEPNCAKCVMCALPFWAEFENQVTITQPPQLIIIHLFLSVIPAIHEIVFSKLNIVVYETLLQLNIPFCVGIHKANPEPWWTTFTL
jgi:hypothetical protein